MFIGEDAVLFSWLFFLYLKYRAAELPVFVDSQRHLDQSLGLLNTVLMLTSSWLVALGVQAAKRRDGRLAARLLTGAGLCGVGFVVVKYVEYTDKIYAGLTPATNDFFMFYFCYTGIHLVHVLIDLGLLTWLIRAARRGELAPSTVTNIETGATFWHLVDLLWVVLFALLYLVGRS